MAEEKRAWGFAFPWGPDCSRSFLSLPSEALAKEGSKHFVIYLAGVSCNNYLEVCDLAGRFGPRSRHRAKCNEPVPSTGKGVLLLRRRRGSAMTGVIARKTCRESGSDKGTKKLFVSARLATESPNV